MRYKKMDDSIVKILKFDHEKCVEILSEYIFSNASEYCGASKNVISGVQVNVADDKIELYATFRSDNNTCKALNEYDKDGSAIPADLSFLHDHDFPEIGKCQEISNDALDKLKSEYIKKS